MFTGFPEETIRYFLDLRFHNNTQFFHDTHERYVEEVQQPFYSFITDLAPSMADIDPQMELRPYKVLSHIHRDTRFTRDKSPYRDHLWIAFRRAAEPKEGSVNFWFELGPDRLGWGMGTWGENKAVNERLQRQIVAEPMRIASIIDRCELAGHHMALTGSFYKRMEVPPQVPERLRPWYTMREIYIPRTNPQRQWVFSRRILDEVRRDFEVQAPIYRLLRGIQDELLDEARQAAADEKKLQRNQDEW